MSEAHEPLDPPRGPIVFAGALTVVSVALSVCIATFLLHAGRGRVLRRAA